MAKLRKNINGVSIEMTDEEEAAFKAQQRKDRREKRRRRQAEHAEWTQAQADAAAIEALVGMPIERFAVAMKLKGKPAPIVPAEDAE